jgi:hypothetical protein
VRLHFSSTHGILAFFFFLTVVTSFLNRSHFPSQALLLIRVFFPSWKLFDQIGHVSQLYYRVCSDEISDFEEWKPSVIHSYSHSRMNSHMHTQRKFSDLFLNSHGNLQLAYQSLVDRLVSDTQDLYESPPHVLLETVSYRLVQNRIQKEILNTQDGRKNSVRFQFKIVIDQEDFLVSPIHETGTGHSKPPKLTGHVIK